MDKNINLLDDFKEPEFDLKDYKKSYIKFRTITIAVLIYFF